LGTPHRVPFSSPESSVRKNHRPESYAVAVPHASPFMRQQSWTAKFIGSSAFYEVINAKE